MIAELLIVDWRRKSRVSSVIGRDTVVRPSSEQSETSQINHRHSLIANQRNLAASARAYQGRTAVGRGLKTHSEWV